METKELKEIKIVPPMGYTIDSENSTFECIRFKPIKKLTYDDVAKELFDRYDYWYADSYGKIIKVNYIETISNNNYNNLNNCTSIRQALKLLAINKLLNTARFLNGKWQPNWDDDTERPYYIEIDTDTDEIEYDWADGCNSQIAYFKTQELAQQAVEILGEDTIRLALSTDW